MISKFRQTKERKLLFCIIDNHDICQDGWSKEISKNLTDFMIFKINLHCYDIFIGKNEDDLLKEAALDNFYSHAIVIASGTSFRRSDRLFEAIENKCKEKFFIAGHILDRDDSYYELHHQFYIINLKEYVSIDLPLIGTEENIKYTTTRPVRSDTFLYNERKIPEWVIYGTEYRTYKKKLHGWNIISKALENGKILLDLGTDVRYNKKYFYYEYNHVFIRQIPEVFYDEFFCRNFFAGWNSDIMRNQLEFDNSIEQYVTVGIGFNWIKNLILLNFNQDTRVIFTDINASCLNFMESMVKNWDGNNYSEFYKNHLPRIPNGNVKLTDSYHAEVDKKWNEFKTSIESWDKIWNKIKNLSFEFVLIDYTSEYNLDWLDPTKHTLINLSNLFNYVSGAQSQSVKYRIACENRLIKRLNLLNPNIMLMLTTRAADGFYIDNKRILLGRISDFTLTDINLLKAPQWHASEWKSDVILD